MTIGIFAPYTHSEVTAMACALGDTIRWLGESAEYASAQLFKRDINHKWDSEVQRLRRGQFKYWAGQLKTIIWFDVQPTRLQTAIKLGCRNILVPCWHNIQECHIEHMQYFDAVVAPHTAAYQQLRMGWSDRHHLIQWDQCLPVIEHPVDLVEKGKLKILVSVNGASIRLFGAELLPVIQLLTHSRQSLQITLAHTRQWTKNATAIARSLVSASRGRVKMLRNPTYRQRMHAIQQHDWMFCASVRANSWWDASEALSKGVPVICFDIPPYNELITHGYNGGVLRCDVMRDISQAPVASVNPKLLLEGLSHLVQSDQLLWTVHSRTWSDVENRVRGFREAWRKLLE